MTLSFPEVNVST